MVKFFPLKWQFDIFRSKFIIPILKSCRCIFFHVNSKCFELLQLAKCLNHIPCSVRKPIQRILNSYPWNTFDEEVHLFESVINLNNFFLHQPECYHCQENKLMLFKETSWNPLINCISDIIYKFLSSSFIFFLSSFNGFEEKFNEALKRILIHMINDAERNT